MRTLEKRVNHFCLNYGSGQVVPHPWWGRYFTVALLALRQTIGFEKPMVFLNASVTQRRTWCWSVLYYYNFVFVFCCCCSCCRGMQVGLFMEIIKSYALFQRSLMFSFWLVVDRYKSSLFNWFIGIHLLYIAVIKRPSDTEYWNCAVTICFGWQ